MSNNYAPCFYRVDAPCFYRVDFVAIPSYIELPRSKTLFKNIEFLLFCIAKRKFRIELFSNQDPQSPQTHGY